MIDREDDELIRSALADPDGLLWIDLHIADQKDGRILREVFDFHPLTIEDAVEARVDPAKIDDHGSYIFIVIQALTEYSPIRQLSAVEVDFYCGPNYVVSCHREDVPSIEMFRARCRRGDANITRGSDWLLHGLLDTLVDEYLPIVDAVDDAIDHLEGRVLQTADPYLLEQIQVVKRNSLRLRRATAPQRDIMNRLARGEFAKLISPEAAIYFRDIYDHLVRVEYLVEALRDLADGALQTYLSVVSNRLNEVMKILTAAATIFLPLTLVSGVYGMNFAHNQFPPFDSSWGFAAVVAGMITLALIMLAFFRYRRWI
jgi:magnesium transporter